MNAPASHTPERTATVTGISAEDLRSIVHAYRHADGAALYSSTGVNMGSNGVLAFWLQEAINAISGNLDRAGGTLVGTTHGDEFRLHARPHRPGTLDLPDSGLDGVRVDYYSTMTPLKQVSNISTPEARLITIQPWEPSLIKEIEKAIANSGLGVTPSNDGKAPRRCGGVPGAE